MSDLETTDSDKTGDVCRGCNNWLRDEERELCASCEELSRIEPDPEVNELAARAWKLIKGA